MRTKESIQKEISIFEAELARLREELTQSEALEAESIKVGNENDNQRLLSLTTVKEALADTDFQLVSKTTGKVFGT